MKRRFKEGDLVEMNTKWLPRSGVIIQFAHYAPMARSHALGKRIPCWNVLCNDGKKFIIGEDNMKLVNRNEEIS